MRLASRFLLLGPTTMQAPTARAVHVARGSRFESCCSPQRSDFQPRLRRPLLLTAAVVVLANTLGSLKILDNQLFVDRQKGEMSRPAGVCARSDAAVRCDWRPMFERSLSPRRVVPLRHATGSVPWRRESAIRMGIGLPRPDLCRWDEWPPPIDWSCALPYRRQMTAMLIASTLNEPPLLSWPRRSSGVEQRSPPAAGHWPTGSWSEHCARCADSRPTLTREFRRPAGGSPRHLEAW